MPPRECEAQTTSLRTNQDSSASSAHQPTPCVERRERLPSEYPKTPPPAAANTAPVRKIACDGGGSPCSVAHLVWCSMSNPFVKFRQRNPKRIITTPRQ